MESSSSLQCSFVTNKPTVEKTLSLSIEAGGTAKRTRWRRQRLLVRSPVVFVRETRLAQRKPSNHGDYVPSRDTDQVQD